MLAFHQHPDISTKQNNTFCRQCMKCHRFMCLGVGVLGLGWVFFVLGFWAMAFCHWHFVPRSDSPLRTNVWRQIVMLTCTRNISLPLPILHKTLSSIQIYIIMSWVRGFPLASMYSRCTCLVIIGSKIALFSDDEPKNINSTRKWGNEWSLACKLRC